MRAAPPKPKKSKFIYIALLCSLLLHLGLVAAPILRAPAPAPAPLKPVSITLNDYQLEPTPTAPKPAPINTPPAAAAISQPKPPVMSAAKPAVKPTAAPEEPAALTQTVPEATVDPQTTAEQTAKATEASESTAQTDTDASDAATEPADDDSSAQSLPENTPLSNGDDEANRPSLAQTSAGPKLTEKDIANNGNLIQPKTGTKPRFPSVAKLRYEGPAGVTGYMSFERGGGRYSLTTTFNIPFYKMAFESTGLVSGQYFKPLRYTDTRKGKIYAQAVFDYDKQEIHYGKGAEPDKTEPLTHHAQDFFTLAWQMALNGGKLTEPMQVTNGKKVYVHSDFSPKGDRQYDSNEGKINVQVFRINKGEDGIEFAFAPDFANIPAQIILTDGGKTYQLRLIGITLDGVDYWQAIRRTRDK